MVALQGPLLNPDDYLEDDEIDPSELIVHFALLLHGHLETIAHLHFLKFLIVHNRPDKNSNQYVSII